MKTVLITGASGFIGRHTIPLLLKHGYEVHAVTSKKPPENGKSEYWHRADLLDRQQIGSLIEAVRPSHLLHFAWIATPGIYQSSFENLHWIEASLELLHRFVRAGGQRIVAAGTCAEYDWRYGFCSEALTPLAPQTLYGSCKHSLQLILSALARENNFSAAWGRIFFPYGPHEHASRLVASVIGALLNGEVARCSHGNQVRDFVFVQDVAAAFVALLDSDIAGPVNIASGRGVAVKEIVFKIGDLLGRRDLVQLGAIPTPAQEAPFLVGDVRLLDETLNWQPEHDIDQGLKKSVEWWQSRLAKG
jgi:nucleoside-diphosphate-sugar epimerase